MWPECKLVHGKPRHSQSQGSVERANRDITDILMMWQRDNQTPKWSDGLWFVQYAKNRRFHSGIGRTPYEAMYGRPMTVGLEGLHLPKVCDITMEEQLVEVCGQSDQGGSDAQDVERPVDEMSDEKCVSCQLPASGAHKCAICSHACHAIQPCSVPMGEEEGYGAPVKCSHCQNAEHRQEQQTGAKRKQEDQADRMKEFSAKRFKAAEVGQCVKVPVPEVDRGKTDPRNILAVVIEVTEDGCYRLGTKNGVLKQLYARNQFDPCKESFLSVEEVPKEKEVSLRQTASVLSDGNGQGFQRCNCSQSTRCNTNKCNCKKRGLLCNSKCHGSATCCNK